MKAACHFYLHRNSRVLHTLKYNRVEKLKIAKEHVDDGLSYDELSKKYDLSKSTIKFQVCLYLAHGEKAFAAVREVKPISPHQANDNFKSLIINFKLALAGFLTNQMNII